MIADAKPPASAGIAADAFDRTPLDGALPQPARTSRLPSDPPPGTTVDMRDPEPEGAISGDETHAGETGPTALSWLGEAVINGLVHCACSHHSVHPDLLTLTSGETPAVQPSSKVVGDDAG